jgi:hypothetical protein
VPALANANDPDMDDQPKTRLICRRCAARMKLARQLPWLDHRLPAILLFQCIDCGHVDMILFGHPPPPVGCPVETQWGPLVLASSISAGILITLCRH